MSQALTHFLTRPAWSVAEVLALEGSVRGVLLRDWAAHLTRRFGTSAVDALRAETGITARDVPDAPKPDAWLRVAHQLILTRAITARWFDNDLLALEPVLREDALRARDRWIDRVVRAALSPRRILAGSSHLHKALYDTGHVTADIDPERIRITWRGARFMTEPTWGALQVFAIRGLFAASREPEPRIDATQEDDGLLLEVRTAQ